MNEVKEGGQFQLGVLPSDRSIKPGVIENPNKSILEKVAEKLKPGAKPIPVGIIRAVARQKGITPDGVEAWVDETIERMKQNRDRGGGFAVEIFSYRKKDGEIDEIPVNERDLINFILVRRRAAARTNQTKRQNPQLIK